MGRLRRELLAVGAFSIRSHPSPPTHLLAWGWRIPFLISGLLVFIGLLIRIGLSEPEKFAEMKQNDTIAERPVVELFRHERRAVYLTTGMRLSQNAIYYLYTVFGIAYIARSLGTATSVGLKLRPRCLSDGPCLRADLGGTCQRFRPSPAAVSVRRRSPAPCSSARSSSSPTPATQSFTPWPGDRIRFLPRPGDVPTRERRSSPEMYFPPECDTVAPRSEVRIGSLFAGGFSPLIATSLARSRQRRPVAFVVGYFTILGVITAVCAYLAPETNKKDIKQQAPIFYQGQGRAAAVHHDTPSPSRRLTEPATYQGAPTLTPEMK